MAFFTNSCSEKLWYMREEIVGRKDSLPKPEKLLYLIMTFGLPLFAELPDCTYVGQNDCALLEQCNSKYMDGHRFADMY